MTSTLKYVHDFVIWVTIQGVIATELGTDCNKDVECNNL